MKIAHIATLTGATLLLAGCGSGSGRAPIVPAATTSIAPALTAAAFVEQAASAALFAIEAAKLAEARARSADVRALAAMQRRDGEAIGAQLSYAGPRVNAVPRNTLLPAHAAMLEALRSASDFDAAYLDQQKEFVRRMRAYHADYGTRGGSATLRPVADYGADKLAAQAEAIERAD